MPALDGIRAVAALVVVAFHARIGFVNGDLGVDVFFVLSGFLITGILLRSGSHGHMDYGAFYRRRALRLLPAYFAVLAVSVVSDQIWDAGGTLKGAFFSFFYVSELGCGVRHQHGPHGPHVVLGDRRAVPVAADPDGRTPFGR